MSTTSPIIHRALISVSDKTGLLEFAQGLVDSGVEILSTGGTARHLQEGGIAVRDVSDYTGFPEMMDGRLKTLHPAVHGGILCRHDRPDDLNSLLKHNIETIELVVVNLYPFSETIAKPGVTKEQAIEQVDIGGPTMVRAAAKNHAFASVVTDKSQYATVLAEIQKDSRTSFPTRQWLAGEAFAHTARYDAVIASYFEKNIVEWVPEEAAKSEEASGEFPAAIAPLALLKNTLRYGENPHQAAAVYSDGTKLANVVDGKQLNGKELSYNNLLDLDAAVGIVAGFTSPTVSVIKHNNPCGAATGDVLAEVVEKAMAGDPLSAFGSVLGFNTPVDAASAEVLAKPGLFIEAIAAPAFSDEALEILTTKPKWKKNVRLVAIGEVTTPPLSLQMRQITGGFLVQQADVEVDPCDEWQIVTKKQPSDAEMADLRFAWEMVRHVKSNAIVLCKEGMLLGAGAGQMSRVDSVEISIKKAGDRVTGSVMGSDAFFPFPDSIERAAEAGITAIIQPGGSVKDNEVIAACDEQGIVMILTGRRHFKH